MAAIISVTMAGVLPAAAEEEIYSYNDYVELTQGETKENSLETLEDFLVETVEQSGNSDEGIEPHYSPVEVHTGPIRTVLTTRKTERNAAVTHGVMNTAIAIVLNLLHQLNVWLLQNTATAFLMILKNMCMKAYVVTTAK